MRMQGASCLSPHKPHALPLCRALLITLCPSVHEQPVLRPSVCHASVPCPLCPRPWASCPPILTPNSPLTHRITHKLTNRPRNRPVVPARLPLQSAQWPRPPWVRALPVATRPVAGRAAASSRSTRRRPSLSIFSSVPTLTVSIVLLGLF